MCSLYYREISHRIATTFALGSLMALTLPISISVVHGAAEIHVEGNTRIISSNRLPDHQIGRFPNRLNPNTVRAHQQSYRMPTQPVWRKTSIPLGRKPFGIALNGVLFDPGTAETFNGDRRWSKEALSGLINLGLDRNNAHVQPNGSYHYHGSPTGLLAKLRRRGSPTLLGFAADGFPIYDQWGLEKGALQSSYRLQRGQRPAGNAGPGGRYSGTYTQDYEYVEGLGDLDACNGRKGHTPEFPAGTYYYVITERFPHVPRCFHGRPDASFKANRMPSPPQREDSRRR